MVFVRHNETGVRGTSLEEPAPKQQNTDTAPTVASGPRCPTPPNLYLLCAVGFIAHIGMSKHIGSVLQFYLYSAEMSLAIVLSWMLEVPS